MPEFTFDGPGPMTYPDSRDSAAVIVGAVEPGGIRDLDEPLDHWWRETTDEDRARAAAAEANAGLEAAGVQGSGATDEDRAGAGTEATASASLQPPASPAPAPPAAPQPAPPAVVPQPDSNAAGQPGTEEG